MTDTPRTVLRWDWTEDGMCELSHGDYVKDDDYRQLERELAEAENLIVNITMGRFAIEDTVNGKKLTAYIVDLTVYPEGEAMSDTPRTDLLRRKIGELLVEHEQLERELSAAIEQIKALEEAGKHERIG